MGLKPITPIIQYSIIPLFGAASRTATGRAGSAGRTGSTLKLPATGKGKGRHHPAHLLPLALRAVNLLGSIEDQFFEIMVALMAMVFINRHVGPSPSRLL